MYKLLNTQGADGEPRAGIAVGDNVYDLEKALGPVTTMGLVCDWQKSAPKLDAFAAKAASGGAEDAKVGPVDGVTLLAPLLYPSALITGRCCMPSGIRDSQD